MCSLGLEEILKILKVWACVTDHKSRRVSEKSHSMKGKLWLYSTEAQSLSEADPIIYN